MDPIPETRRALESLGDSGSDVLHQLLERAEHVRALVPSCVGITLAMVRDGLAFTVAATSSDAAEVDGVQYVADGPCATAAETGRPTVHNRGDALDEGEWELFARASAASGIASTLTLPIVVGEEVLGTVNLYAGAPGAFAGHAEELATVFEAWAPGAVTNADLGFTTREAARRTEEQLEEEAVVSRAVGIVMADLDVDADAAGAVLADAALRAGITEVEVARRLVLASQHDD